MRNGSIRRDNRCLLGEPPFRQQLKALVWTRGPLRPRHKLRFVRNRSNLGRGLNKKLASKILRAVCRQKSENQKSDTPSFCHARLIPWRRRTSRLELRISVAAHISFHPVGGGSTTASPIAHHVVYSFFSNSCTMSDLNELTVCFTCFSTAEIPWLSPLA